MSPMILISDSFIAPCFVSLSFPKPNIFINLVVYRLRQVMSFYILSELRFLCLISYTRFTLLVGLTTGPLPFLPDNILYLVSLRIEYRLRQQNLRIVFFTRVYSRNDPWMTRDTLDRQRSLTLVKWVKTSPWKVLKKFHNEKTHV